MKNFFIAKYIIQEELDNLNLYSEKSIEELSILIDQKLLKKLSEKDLFMFSKREIAELIHITTKYLNDILTTLPEEIQFKNIRSLLSINAAIHYFFTPFIISRVIHKRLASVIHEVAKF